MLHPLYIFWQIYKEVQLLYTGIVLCWIIRTVTLTNAHVLTGGAVLQKELERNNMCTINNTGGSYIQCNVTVFTIAII